MLSIVRSSSGQGSLARSLADRLLALGMDDEESGAGVDVPDGPAETTKPSFASASMKAACSSQRAGPGRK
jgi:hypothetical protein